MKRGRIATGASPDGPHALFRGALVEQLLAELYAPARTRTGNISMKKGRPEYDGDDLIEFCGRYVGVSVHPDAILSYRLGELRAPFVRSYLDRLARRLEAGVDAALYVRRDRFRMHGRSALHHYEKFGGAPDGDPSIFDFLERLAQRLDGVDVSVLDEAAALEGREPEGRAPSSWVPILPEVDGPVPQGTDFPKLRARLEALDEIPLSLSNYMLEDGRFVFGEQTPGYDGAKRVLLAAFEARLCRFES